MIVSACVGDDDGRGERQEDNSKLAEATVPREHPVEVAGTAGPHRSSVVRNSYCIYRFGLLTSSQAIVLVCHQRDFVDGANVLGHLPLREDSEGGPSGMERLVAYSANAKPPPCRSRSSWPPPPHLVKVQRGACVGHELDDPRLSEAHAVPVVDVLENLMSRAEEGQARRTGNERKHHFVLRLSATAPDKEPAPAPLGTRDLCQAARSPRCR